MKPQPPVTRLQFVQNMVENGLSYDQAIRAYNSVMSTIADGVVNSRRIYLGSVGVMKPTVIPPRSVKMGFKKVSGGRVLLQQREFFLDSRIKYSFRMFKKFAQTHELKFTG